MSLSSQVIKGLRYSTGYRLLGQLITWALTLVVIRILSPQDYGLVTTAGVITNGFALLSEVGLGPAVVQAENMDEKTLRKVFGVTLVFNLLLSILLCLVAPLVADLYNEPILTPIIQFKAINFILLSLLVVPQALAMRGLHYKVISVVEFIAAVVGSVATLLLALGGFEVWALVYGSSIILLTKLILFQIRFPFLKVPSIDFKSIVDLIKFGGNVTMAKVTWFVYDQADVFLIGKFLGQEALGYYAVALSFSNFPLQKLTGILNVVGMPAFAKLQLDKPTAARYFIKVLSIASVISFPIFVGLASVSPEAVRLLLGNAWLPAALPLACTSLVVPLKVMASSFESVTLGMGRAEMEFKNKLIFTAFMLPALTLGCQFGLEGVLAAWLLAFPAAFLVVLGRTAGIVGAPYPQVLGAMLTPALFSGVMYAVVYGLRQANLSALGNSLELSVLVLTGGLVYVSSMFIFSRDRVADVMRLTHR